jgi:hypothetical protein
MMGDSWTVFVTSEEEDAESVTPPARARSVAAIETTSAPAMLVTDPLAFARAAAT